LRVVVSRELQDAGRGWVMDIGETGCEGLEWITLAQDRGS
jgi:hypothetical protein